MSENIDELITQRAIKKNRNKYKTKLNDKVGMSVPKVHKQDL